MQQLTSLQALRAVAAVMVVVFHINGFILPRLYNGSIAWDVFKVGYSGVELFFAISGFIMMYIHCKDINQPQKAPRYFFKRFGRIYPFYWFVLIVVLFAALIAPSIAAQTNVTPFEMVNNFLLLPVHTELILAVPWTLKHEMLFYIMFGTLLFSRRLGIIVLGIWFSTCAIFLLINPKDYLLVTALSPYNLIFLGGIVTALYFDRLRSSGALSTLAVGTILFFAVGLIYLYKIIPLSVGWRTIGLGVGASLIIMGLVASDRIGKIRPPNWLNKIGDSSYSLYLTHLPILLALSASFENTIITSSLTPLTMLFLMTFIVTILGLIVHVYIEKPLIRFASNIPANTQKFTSKFWR